MCDLYRGYVHEHFGAFAIIAVIIGSLFASTARANTTWTVTVDVTQANDIPTYSITSNPPGAKNCAGATPIGDPSKGDVQICPGDAIYWRFTTNGKKGWLTVHQNDGVLKDSSYNPKYWFRKKERETQNPGGTTNTNEPDNTFKYCVAVHDDYAGRTRLYTHDPKIIIGSGSPFERLDAVQHACDRLIASISNSSEAEKARTICKDAEKDLKELLSQK